MRIFSRINKKRMLAKNNADENRKVAVVKTGENSWQIVYADEIEGYDAKKGILLSELFKGCKK